MYLKSNSYAEYKHHPKISKMSKQFNRSEQKIWRLYQRSCTVDDHMKRCSMSLVFREMQIKAKWDVKTSKGPEILPYLYTNKLACYSFTNSERRHKTSRSEIKGSLLLPVQQHGLYIHAGSPLSKYHGATRRQVYIDAVHAAWVYVRAKKHKVW